MIEINLIPDVKLELIRAKRQRANVISIAIVAAIASLAAMTILAFYTYGVQTITGKLADSAIQKEFTKLSNVKDLSKTLTVQSQLGELDSLHNDKHISSRIFDMISTVVPEGKNRVAITSLTLDSEESVISIEGEAVNGYEALEVFKKTIAQTKFSYMQDGMTKEPVALATKITDGERRYGENSEGQRVLRFELKFGYISELFSPTAENGRIIAPDKQNATDSAKGVPKSLFTNKAEEETQ